LHYKLPFVGVLLKTHVPTYCSESTIDYSYFSSLQAFCSNGFISNYILEIASCADVLPTDILANHPGQACLLANVLETATWILSEPDFAPESVGVLLCFENKHVTTAFRLF
jgi:hypothetical protein